MQSCPFFEKLPAEVRLRIYEHLLTFDAPIKLRQVVPGSRDLGVLRVCQQIYQEVSLNLVVRNPYFAVSWILQRKTFAFIVTTATLPP